MKHKVDDRTMVHVTFTKNNVTNRRNLMTAERALRKGDISRIQLSLDPPDIEPEKADDEQEDSNSGN